LTSVSWSGVDRQLRGESPLVSRSRFGARDVGREAWEFVVKNYPNSDAANQARQRLLAPTIKPD